MEIPRSLGPRDQNYPEPEILRRLLDQFDAPEIRRQLADSRIYRPDDLVPGDQVLAQLMRCIQSSDVDFGGRNLNEIVAQTLVI